MREARPQSVAARTELQRRDAAGRPIPRFRTRRPQTPPTHPAFIGASASTLRQIGACRNETDAACETALKGEEGQLATVVADSEEPVRRNCTADAANKLTFLLGVDELNDAFFKVSAWRHTEYR
jgi:hypothetical protein